MTAHHVLGLDPAAGGAAVLLRRDGDGSPVLVWACNWRRRQRGSRPAWVLQSVAPDGAVLEVATRSPALLGLQIGLQACHVLRRAEARLDALVIEAPYVSRRNPGTSLKIARLGGLVAGGILASLTVHSHVVAPVDDPPRVVEAEPAAWRHALGLGGGQRDVVKARSLAHMPALVPGLRGVCDALDPTSDDLTDAAGIALVGARLRAWDDGWGDRLDAARRRRRR